MQLNSGTTSQISTRFDSSMVLVTDSNWLVFGGTQDDWSTTNSLWKYSTDLHNWVLLEPATVLPPPLNDHSAVYQTCSERMFVFGGITPTGVTADLWIYSVGTNQWSLAIPTTPWPTPRSGHSAIISTYEGNDEMTVFGGTDSQGVPLNEIWVYNIAHNRWTEVTPSGTKPPSRSYHSGTFYPSSRKGQLVIFGGFANNSEMNDLWIFDFDTSKWSLLSSGSSSIRSRSGHIASIYGSKLIIFGGESYENGLWSTLNDLWVFDIHNRTWQSLTTSPVPASRLGGKSVTLSNGSLVVFGGIQLQNGTDWTPSQWFNDLWVLHIST